MLLGIDPTVDYAFKHLLGRDATRPLLISVLNSVLNPPPGHGVYDIELMNPFNPKESPSDKLSILDIKARDQSGWQFNVEMQMVAFLCYEKRILYYWSKLHQQQLQAGQDYVELKLTISISFLNHVLFPDTKDYHLRFRLLEARGHFALTDDLEFHVLELPKFTKTLTELHTDLDIWLYFLRHAEMMDTEAIPAELQRQPLMVQAMKELRMLTQTDLEREQYEARRKWQLDWNTSMKVSHMQGLAAGKIEVIHAFEQVLQRPETPTEQLLRLSLDDLSRMADDLKAQVLKQR
jgi:predicted transposase/invertase (TIGR01784 family)